MQQLFRSAILSLLAACFSSALLHGQVFQMPLRGTPGIDYWMAYYVDHDQSRFCRDGYCGSKTYNNHKGTDFMLRSFKTMDSGVKVLAVADGVVVYEVDSFFDRQKKWINGSYPNLIRVRHGAYIVDYLHLKKNGNLVREGDSVRAGQQIGSVGSSGYSMYPHLHLEMRDSANNLIDPFGVGCNDKRGFVWSPDPGYDTASYAIDFGYVPYVPNLDTLEERYDGRTAFYNYKDTVVCLWSLVHGLKSGDQIRIDWYDPDRALYFTYSHTWKRKWWYDYTWAYLDLPLRKGKWRTRLFLNGKMRVASSFIVE